MPLRRPAEDVVYGYSPNHFPLTCAVLSDETPERVIWSGPSNSVIDNAKKEEKIVEGNLTLTYYILNLTSPSSGDSGAYTCTFDFESGPSVHETFPDVQFNDIEIANQPRVYATASGVTVRLECAVTSHKSLKLGWYDIDHDDWITPTNRTYEDNVTNAYYNLEVNFRTEIMFFLTFLLFSKQHIFEAKLTRHKAYPHIKRQDSTKLVHYHH